MTSALEAVGVSQQRLMEALKPSMPEFSALLAPNISSVAGATDRSL